MSFTGTQDLTIAGSATNIVHGDQYNSSTKIIKTIRVHQRGGRTSKQQQTRKKRAEEIDLIDEYREIRLGDIYRVEKTGSLNGYWWEWELDGEEQHSCTKTGEKHFYRAKLYGNDNMFTAITYTGRDALELWKKDFAAYSESHNTAMAFQLFGVNRSKVPALLFYNDWIPMAHFCPKGNFWTRFYAGLLMDHMLCNTSALWLNSQSGYFSVGPDGPFVGGISARHIVDSLCSTADLLNTDTCVRYLSKVAGSDLDNDVLDWARFSYNFMCINDVFGVQHQCSQACIHTGWSMVEWKKDNGGLWKRAPLEGYIADKVSDFLNDLDFNVVYSGTQFRKIAFSKGKGRLQNPCYTPWHPALHGQTVVAGGMTRFLLDDFDLTSSTGLFVYLNDPPAMTWLSQAHRIFSTVDDINDIEKCFLADFTVFVSIAPECIDYPCSEHSESFNQVDEPDTKSPIYLFIQSLPTRLAEVDDWLNSQVFFWSYDENGATQISEDTQRCLGLPNLTLYGPRVLLRSWKKYVYDAVYTWQVARGFDPTTSDFARSLGYSILQPVPNKDLSEAPREEPSVSTTVDGSSRCQSDIASSPRPTSIEDQESGSSSEEDREPESKSLLSKFQLTLSWWQATSDIPAFG